MPQTEAENRRIAGEVEKIHMESPDKGYRRIRDDLQRYHDIDVNGKRVLRICRKLGIKSTIKYANEGCTQQADKPQCKCQYKNDQKVENKNVHLPRAIPQPVLP